MAIERLLAEDREPGDALDRLSRLGAPTGDIDRQSAFISPAGANAGPA